MRYYISDQHFYHGNMNDHMDHRGFADADEMNAYMISQWNKKVRPQDEVVILGDLSLGNGEDTNRIVDQLNGRLFLVVGNHDKRFLRDKKFNRDRFEWINKYKELKDNKRKIVLSHYPILFYNGQYHRDKDGTAKTYMLYGHVHNTYDEILINQFIREMRTHKRTLQDDDEKLYPIPCQMINCFCMFSDYQPLTLDEWITLDEKRRAGIRT